MANQTSEEYTEQLFQAIDTIVSNRVKDLPYDQTIICTITDDTQAEYGKYTVTTNAGAQFTVYSENTSYINGDRVYVRVPQNDFSAQKIITGAYVKGDTGADSSSLKDNFYSIKSKILQDGVLLNINTNDSVKVFDDTDRQNKRYNGFLVSRLTFTIVNDKNFVKQFKKSENGLAADYTQNDIDARFTISVIYKRPDSYNSDELQQKSFSVNLRNIQPNIFRQNSYRFKYDLDYKELVTNSGIEPDVLLQEVKISDFKFVGDPDKIAALESVLPLGIVPVKLEIDENFEFGYYIENNIGYYIHLFSEDNNFYDIDKNNNYNKELYFYCYYTLENNRARLILPSEMSLTTLNALKLRAQIGGNDITFFPTLDGQTAYIKYENNLGRYKLTLNKENGGLKEDSISLICNIGLITGDISNPVILIDDTLTLTNSGYGNYWGRFRGKSKFLYAITESSAIRTILDVIGIEDISDVHYAYGQDGKPTDSKVSYVKYGCFVRFNDPDGTALNDTMGDKIGVTVDTGGKDLDSASMLRYPNNNQKWEIKFDNENGLAYVEYKISNYYSQHKNKNTFYWTFTPDGEGTEPYVLEVPIYFGYNGSQGSEYNLVLDIVRKETNTGEYVLEQAIRLGSDNKPVGDYYIRSTLYNYDNKECTNITSDKYNASLMLTAYDSTDYVTGFGPAISSSNGMYNYFQIQFRGGALPFNETNVKKYGQVAVVIIEELVIEAFLPLAFAKDPNNKYKLSGPSTITYDITGKKPNSQKIPYSLMHDTQVQSYNYVLYIHDKDAEQFPKLADDTAVVQNYLMIPSAYTEAMNMAPPTMYIKQGNDIVWVQPIYICQNKYPAAMTNGEQHETVIKENENPGSITSISVGKIINTEGTGLFIGNYKHSTDAQPVYGLYAFGNSGATNPKSVNNTFKLLGDGTFEADMTLLKKNTANKMIKVSSVANSTTYPVGYKSGKPVTIQNVPVYKVYTDTPHDSTTQATLLDVAKGVIAIKELLEQIYSTTPPTNEEILEELDEIKLEVEE